MNFKNIKEKVKIMRIKKSFIQQKIAHWICWKPLYNIKKRRNIHTFCKTPVPRKTSKQNQVMHNISSWLKILHCKKYSPTLPPSRERDKKTGSETRMLIKIVEHILKLKWEFTFSFLYLKLTEWNQCRESNSLYWSSNFRM